MENGYSNRGRKIPFLQRNKENKIKNSDMGKTKLNLNANTNPSNSVFPSSSNVLAANSNSNNEGTTLNDFMNVSCSQPAISSNTV